jgi:acyl-CoA synthetase (NDP forming)
LDRKQVEYFCYHYLRTRRDSVDSNQIILRARSDGRTMLTEVESKELVLGAGIATVETRLALSQKEAIAISKEIGFPVVLKIVSPDIVHKSDIGGVKVGLTSVTGVAKAYREIMAAARSSYPKARIDGVSVQKMVGSGVEVIIGMSKDPQFGPVIMFGLGGILVELLKDVSFRVVPLNRRDAAEMIREVKGYPLLDGYRGRERVNVALLEEMILRVSDLAERNPEIKELDLNPVIVGKSSAVAVDARIVL